MIDPHNLGTFNSFEEVWSLYPSGGCPGDYITVSSVVVRWNEGQRSWGDPKTFQDNIKYERIEGNVEVSGDLKSSSFESNEASVNTFKTKYIFIENDPYSKKGHNHDDLYSKIGHVHPGLTPTGVSNSENSNHADVAHTLDQDTPVKDWFVRKDIPDTVKKLITFIEGLTSKELAILNKGATFGQFINSMTNGKGAGIDENGKAQFESVEVRTYFKALEVIANRLSAMEGDYSFTELGTIDAVEDLGENTLKLTIRKRWDTDFTAFGENNIIYGVFNSIAAGTGAEVYTSWGRVLSVNTNDNTITTLLYSDTEVPGGKNFPFVKGMNITRKGDSNSPLDGSRNSDQDSWVLSSTEG